LCIDKYGFKVFASITNLKAGRTPSPFQYNKYALENIKHYCKIIRLDYEILSDIYISIKTQYKWIYIGKNLPSHIDPIFLQTADVFINGGVGHPYFGKSNGNKIFENELIKNNILYKDEKKFKDCRDKNPLKFDFYIIDVNEIIEIDGIQHTQIVEYFGGKGGYEDRIRKDNIKNDYCKRNEIMLTRIPYENIKLEDYKALVDFHIQRIILKLNREC